MEANVVPVAATVVRWSARLLSVVILLFWGFLLVAHLFGEAGRASRPLTSADYILLAVMILSLVGLLLSWKWEFNGAVMTLVAVLIGAIVNWRVLIFPGTLIPVAAVLFVASWWLARATRRRVNA